MEKLNLLVCIVLAIAQVALATYTHTDAAKAASYIGGKTLLNRGNTGVFNVMKVGTYVDQVFWTKTTYYGRYVLFFDGTDPNLLDIQGWTQWYSNGQCGLGTNGCYNTAQTYSQTVYAAIPTYWKTANNVICVGFSRGNFFMSDFIWRYPNVCSYFVSVGSPGMIRSPIGKAITLEHWSLLDPISQLNLPAYYSDYSHEYLTTVHWWDTYGNAMISWSGLNDNSDFLNRLVVWGI